VTEAAESSDVRAVLASFPVLAACRWRPLGRGHATAKWLIRSNGRPYVLRQLPAGMSPARMRFVAASQNHVARACRLAAPLHRTDRGGLVLDHRGAGYVLASYLPGHPPAQGALPLDICRSLGRCLGLLHRCYGRFTAETRGALLMRLPEQPQMHLVEVLDHVPRDAPRLASRALRFKIDRLSQFTPAQIDKLRRLPMTTIHGDFYPDNTLLLPGETTTVRVLDFDRSCVFFRAYEVARGMTLCARPTTNWPATRARLHAFLSAYQREGPLNQEETERMLDLYLYIQLSDTYGLIPDLDGRPLSPALRRFGTHRFLLLRWLDENQDRLQRTIQFATAANTGDDAP
jgi:Ser/Thr protein kinase RdoA (MazF antagonist)